MTSIMEEIPLVFPNNAVPKRYFVDIYRECLVRSDEEENPLKNDPSDGDVSGRPLSEALPGAASVSELKIRGKEMLVTTSALVHNPSIVSVALSWNSKEEDSSESPLLVELNVNDLQVIAIRAFSVDPDHQGASNSPPSFHLVLVGCQGTIVTVTLDENLNVNTEEPLRVLYAKDYVPPSMHQQVVVSSLIPNMVSFLTGLKRQVLIALAPLILTVDWMETGTAAVWSETQCLEEMKSHQTIFASMSLSNFVFGKFDAGIVDLPPTAAVCVATSKIRDSEASDLVFTLHSDASIRMWRINPESSMLPFEVSTLNTETLSSPSTWSDSRDSVAVCAKRYEQGFALGVYIKTDTLREGASDCNMWAFHGSVDGQANFPPLELKVPDDAVSLVNMAFVPNEHRCNLSAVFECFDGGGGTSESTSGIKVANYPPGLTSIVGSEPDIVMANTLDKVAMNERDRIHALSYGSIILKDFANGVDDAVSSTDEALHRVDTMYMKYLFRPMFPRGDGTVLSASDVNIRRALAKLVHGAIKNHGMSIELEVVKTLYEWRARDKRKTIGSTWRQSGQFENANAFVSPSKGQSVYESFLQADEDDQSMGIDKVDELDEQEQIEDELVAEVEAHDKRWVRLLYQIWEEEHIVRVALRVAWMDSLPAQVVVRGGVTSLLVLQNENPETSPATRELDLACARLLSTIETDQNKSRELYRIEQKAALVVSEAKVGLYPQATSGIIEELTFLGRWAQNQGGDIQGRNKLRELTKKLSLIDLVQWLEEEPGGTNSFGKQATFGESRGPNAAQIANAQVRHAASSCSIRVADAIRRSRLGKCLLLLNLAVGDVATSASFRAYLSSLSLLWTMGQRMKIPDTLIRATKVRFSESPSSSSPPNKRLSFGDVPSSILGPDTFVTTVLDVVMIEISQNIMTVEVSSPDANVLRLTRGLMARMFNTTRSFTDGVRSLMPELMFLPKTRDNAIATENPKLALRMLAPYVTFPVSTDSAESVIRRKEEMSSCLLLSSESSAFSSLQKSKMMYKAFNLLAPASSDLGNPVEEKMMENGLDILRSYDSQDIPGTELTIVLTNLLPRAASIEVSRVAQLDTSKRLFSSITAASLASFSDLDRSSLSTIATAMLRLSRIFRRLNILENYVAKGYDDGAGGYDADSLLQIISDAIVEMESTFPNDILLTSNEYRSLWTKKFNHARQSHRWTEAYNAALRNPVERYREENLKLLVKGMVDNGALDELLAKCGPIRYIDSGMAVDFYEIASTVLLYNSMGQEIYDMRANSQKPQNISDYQGALYALHASQLQWKRAAQSLDLRYLQAEKCLEAKIDTAGANIQTTELRDGLVVDDLVLASAAAANAIRLVKNPDGRFLMSGEYGWHNDLAVGNVTSSTTSTPLKRGRISAEAPSPRRTEKDDSEDRLSRFMGIVQLDGRAVRSIGLRTLFFDRSTDYHSTKLAFLREFNTQADVSVLFSNGYYQYGLILAKEWSEGLGALNGSTKRGGVDLFGCKIGILLKDYLIPLSLGACDAPRPTLQQLQGAIDIAAASPAMPSYVATERSMSLGSLSSSAFRAATSELIRKFTINYSSAEIPISIDVATSLLDQGHIRHLPVWLERLLMGVRASESGAFAPRIARGSKGTYLGDPAKLLRLYIERGMFLNACNVIISVLQRDCSEIELLTRATSRLPEKGNIDFIPYRTIDVLWNLIELAVTKGSYEGKEKSKILKARDDMESALSKHFELLNTSEAGIRSARLM